MGMRTVTDYCGGHTPLLEKMIGQDAFPAVKSVSAKLAEIAFLAENMTDVALVADGLRGEISGQLVVADGSTEPRSLAERFGDTVSPYDFGAVGDGVADDTAAWAAAISTGKQVEDRRGGRFKITAALPTLAEGQRILGAGNYKTRLELYGSFQLFTINKRGCAVGDIYILGTNQTGGGIFHISAGHRCRLWNIETGLVWNFLYVDSTNNLSCVNLYNFNNRGEFSYRLFGDDTKRTDGVMLRDCYFSADAAHKPIGIDWDGNVHSVFLFGGGALRQHSKALWIRNTSNTMTPAFLQLVDFSFEYCDHGAYIETGYSIQMLNMYSHGHFVGSGVYVAPGAPGGQVRISNAQISGCTRYGIENASGGDVMALNIGFSANDLGDVSGLLRARVNGLSLDPLCYWILDSLGRPTQAHDANDYDQYDRANDRRRFILGGAEVLGMTPQRIDAAVPVRSPSYTVGTLPDPVIYARCSISVSGRPAWSDGVNWRWADLSIVS